MFGCDEFEDVDDVSSSSFPIMYEDVLEDRVEQECRSLGNRLNHQIWFGKCETLSCFDAGHMLSCLGLCVDYCKL